MHRSQNYTNENVCAQYLGMRIDGIVILYEVDSKGYTIKETVVNLNCYPETIQQQVKELQGKSFNQVKL